MHSRLFRVTSSTPLSRCAARRLTSSAQLARGANPTVRRFHRVTGPCLDVGDKPYAPGSEFIPTTTEELVGQFGSLAKERDEELRKKHHELKMEFPEHSFAPGRTDVDKDLANRKRLIYRSKQRGWLEVDLLLGSWASEFVMTLNEEQLVQYEAILNQETLDIYNFIIERDDVPEELETEVMQMLRKFAQESGVVGAGTPEDYEKNMKSKMSN